jgi:hypothetical protein
LGKPARRELVELIVALVDSFAYPDLSRFEGLSFVTPPQRKNACKLESLRFFTNFIDVVKLETGANHDGTIILRRAQDKGGARYCGRRLVNGLGDSEPRKARSGYSQGHCDQDKLIHGSD